MNRTKLAESREWIRAELDRCVNFWLKNGMDPDSLAALKDKLSRA